MDPESHTGASIHPGATEVIGKGTDETCDGQEICDLDNDDDGYRPNAVLTAA